MRKRLFPVLSLVALAFISCNNTPKEDYSWIKKGIDVASAQLKITAEEIADSAKIPKSIWVGYNMEFLCHQLDKDSTEFKNTLRKIPYNRLGERRIASIYDWVSGFFPGTLWYTYALTGDQELKQQAISFTNLLNPLKDYTETHDLGFMVNCSFGNARIFAPNDSILPIMKQTADNLIARYNPTIKAIRSWDFGWWNYPVIIDNMMNLDLLFEVSKATNDPKYKEVALTHANTTMIHHYRPDYSCYHVISYNNDGTIEAKNTHQGKNHESAWARGQSWGVYGYLSCYRETGDKKYLDFALKAAALIIDRVKTADLIPYWDYDAPQEEGTPRDASAASILASAFIELSTMVPDGQKYLDYAETILKNLSSDAYLAKVGENQGFILMHSTGSLPHGSEIDTPLSYADYYYMEALKRYMDLKGLTYDKL